MSRGGNLQAEVQVITTAQQYDDLIQASHSKVVIVDLHMTWCGPCAALQPTLNKIMMDYEDANLRVVFASCDFENLTSKVQSTFVSDSAVHLNKHGSLPLQAVYRFGSNIGLLQGVDSPALLALIEINIPPLAEKSE